MANPENSSYEFGPFRFEPHEYCLWRDAKKVVLSARPRDLLLFFVQNPGKLFETAALLDAVWGDDHVEEGNVAVTVGELRKRLGKKYIKTVARRGYCFTAIVKTNASREQASPVHPLPDGLSKAAPGPLRGALPVNSPFYIVRAVDPEFHAGIMRGDTFVHIRGPRQMGKTSLLARGLHQARCAGSRVALTDMQAIGDVFTSLDRFLQELGQQLADQLGVAVRPHQRWESFRGSSSNFESYLCEEILDSIDTRLVWALDEVDTLFKYSYKDEVFGLFRSWHNRRATQPGSHWDRLTMTLAYATEAHLFISDPNQSPFNVGTRLFMEDFNLDQVADLNERHGSPLTAAEIDIFFGLAGGHPYLTQCGLHAIASRRLDFGTLIKQAVRDDGVFGDNLRGMLKAAKADAMLTDSLCLVLAGKSGLPYDHFERLQAAGILTGDSPSEARIRCFLYADYLEKHLS